MKFYILASGSKGNSTFIDFDGCGVLIDCGISKRRLVNSLQTIGYCMDDIKYVFLTHDHSDHNKNIHIFPSEMIYAPEGCDDNANCITHYDVMNFEKFTLIPLKTSHDATNAMGLVFIQNHERLIYMTDTGYVSRKNASYMVDADYYIMESNHDIDMLWHSGRPKYLINRILSDKGHLSNLDSATMMTRLVGPHTKRVILAHLSEDCNTEQCALQTYRDVFRNAGHETLPFDLVAARQSEMVVGGESNEN